jgi:hypothetical protein
MLNNFIGTIYLLTDNWYNIKKIIPDCILNNVYYEILC